MLPIVYLKGDATQPLLHYPGEQAYIVHICNDIGAWGKGFVLALSKRWKKPEQVFRKKSSYELGTIDCVEVKKDCFVINMIAQHGICNDKNTGLPPIRYTELEKCLNKMSDMVLETQRGVHYSIHMPRMGCGLAGGDWNTIKEFVIKALSNNDIQVYVYDLS